MARIRTIKPEFFRSRSLSRCSRDARFTFTGMWCEADSMGRGIADARILKGAIWPLDDDITPPVIDLHLEQLAREHITLYEVDGERYFEIRNWEKHQAASYRQGEPVHPAPPSHEPCTPPHASRMSSSAVREGKGREGNARARAVHTPVPEPDDFDEFWACYPRKTARKRAATVWRRLTLTERQLALDAVPAHCARWKREHPTTTQFVPHASTWLNDKRWEDELPRENPLSIVDLHGNHLAPGVG